MLSSASRMKLGAPPCRIASSKRFFPPTSLKALMSVTSQFWPTLRKGLNRALACFGVSLEPASFDAVIDDEKLAHGLRLNGVPLFVLEGNYLFSGAADLSHGASVARGERKTDLGRSGTFPGAC